jgi:hypothetical protein
MVWNELYCHIMAELTLLNEVAYKSATEEGKIQLLEEKRLQLQAFYNQLPEDDEIASLSYEDVFEASGANANSEVKTTKRHDAIASTVENLRFEVWRWKRFDTNRSRYVYQSVGVAANLFKPAPSEQKTEAPYRTYLVETYDTLRQYFNTPIVINDSKNDDQVLSFGRLVELMWPATKTEQDALEDESSVVPVLKLREWTARAGNFVKKVIEWRANFDKALTIETPLPVTPKSTTLPKKQPAQNPPVGKTTEPTSTTTTKTNTNDTPSLSDEDVPLVETPEISEIEQLRITNENLQQRLDATQTQSLERQRRIEKLETWEKRYTKQLKMATSEKEDAISALINVNQLYKNLLAANQKLKEDLDTQFKQLTRVDTIDDKVKNLQEGFDETARQLKELLDIQASHIKVDTETKQAVVSQEPNETLYVFYEMKEIYSVFLVAEVEALVNAYNSRGTTSTGLFSVHARATQQRLQDLAVEQYGTQRLFLTTRDSDGTPSGSIEIARLSPQSTPDHRRQLIANLNDRQTQVAYRAGQRDNSIPANGSLTIDVYDQGRLMATHAISYDGREQVSTLSENAAVKLYTTATNDKSVRLDMIVVAY